MNAVENGQPQQLQFLDATPDDAEGIRSVQRATWLATYPNPALGITKEDIEAKVTDMIGSDGVERLRQRLAEQTSSHTWVAKDSESIIGFVGVQKLEQENKIRAFYILPEYQGKGIGKMLMQNALAWLDPAKQTSLEVVSYNSRAIAFYKSFGFEERGETTNDAAYLPSGKVFPEILMVRSV